MQGGKVSMGDKTTLRNSALNLTFNVLSMAISMGLSFWITPYLTNTIGAEAYGLIPLTQQFVNYMSVITVSITAISGRFFTMARRRGANLEAQEYFSSTLFMTVAAGAVLLIPFIISIMSLDKIINIPVGFHDDVKKTYIIFIVVFILNFITSAFHDGPFSENKLFYTSGINILQLVVKTAVTVALCVLFVPRIWFVSVGVLCGAAVTLIMSVWAFKKLVPDIKIKLKPHNRVKEILSSGIWISISEVGVILFLQIDLFVSNHFASLKEAGEYAVVLQLPSILRTFSGTIISIFIPVVISLYAAGKTEEMKKYVNNAVKYTGIVLSLPIGIICGLGGTLLSLWINPDFAKYQLILSILTIHLSINLSVQVVASIQTAMAKLRTPAFVTLIMGGINLGLACLLAGYFKMGVMGIAIAGSIVLTCKNLLFTPIYVAYITGSKWYTYFIGVIRPFFATAAVSLFCFMLQKLLIIPNLAVFVLVCCGVGVVYLVFVWFVMISRTERKRFIGFVKSKLSHRS